MVSWPIPHDVLLGAAVAKMDGESEGEKEMDDSRHTHGYDRWTGPPARLSEERPRGRSPNSSHPERARRVKEHQHGRFLASSIFWGRMGQAHPPS